ncbi:MAG: TRZ/ATZ family hydrolase [Hahellaceae bacterium]|nr:TRZ/ATZ family hydrolase [Hahellaceae bacterium]
MIDTLIFARWIVPIRPAHTCLEHHALAIHQGRIVDLLPADLARESYTATQVIERPQGVLMPGLINAHGHAAMTLFRGLADDLPLMDWLNHHIWPAEGRWVSESFVRAGTRLAVAEMLRGGTTTFSDMYFYPEVVADVAASVSMRCQTAFPVLDFPTPWGAGPDDYLRKGLALIDEYRGSQLVSIAFGPHAPYTVSDDPLRRIVTLAEQTGRPIQIHLHETAFEVESALQQTGLRPLVRLHQLGLLGPQTQCVHMTQLNTSDIEILTQTNAHVVHCPQSNLKLASGFCPIHKLQQAGVNVALGTDGAASNNDLDLWDEMRTAALLAKAVAGDAQATPAFYALEMATLNGAKALGLEDQTGSLEPGKFADCIVVDLSALHAQPLYQAPSHLVYATHAHQVSDVWVQGKRLLCEGILQGLSSEALIEEACHWAEKIRQS